MACTVPETGGGPAPLVMALHSFMLCGRMLIAYATIRTRHVQFMRHQLFRHPRGGGAFAFASLAFCAEDRSHIGASE